MAMIMISELLSAGLMDPLAMANRHWHRPLRSAMLQRDAF